MATVDFAKQEKMVIDTLMNCPEARDDDYIMLAEIIKRYYPWLYEVSFGRALRDHEELGVPSFESFARVRRKIQSKVPALESKRKKEKRAKMEAQFRNYAKGVAIK